jgi:hypothetical protein
VKPHYTLAKDILLTRRLDAGFVELFNLACGKRPEEEMYNLEKDPNGLRNVAGTTDYRQQQAKLRTSLDDWMKTTDDPRFSAGGTYEAFDRYPYYGGPAVDRPTTARPARAS